MNTLHDTFKAEVRRIVRDLVRDEVLKMQREWSRLNSMAERCRVRDDPIRLGQPRERPVAKARSDC